MIRFLLSVAISLVSAALALLVAAWLIDGVTVQTTGFVVAVVVFSVAQGLLGPFVFNVARKYASAVLGGIGLVSTVLGAVRGDAVPRRPADQGLTAWIVTPLVVWLITALGTWILGALIIQRWWERRQQRSSAPTRD